MSYEPEKPVSEELAGGRQRIRKVVPGMRYVQRLVKSGVYMHPMTVLQQRVCIGIIGSGMLISESYEWEDVPTEQE